MEKVGQLQTTFLVQIKINLLFANIKMLHSAELIVFIFISIVKKFVHRVYLNLSLKLTIGIYFKNVHNTSLCMLINNETLKHFQESNALKFKEAKY